MNFYPMYPGDYARDTAHLSLAEHGAYVTMLNHQYATERPLPPDVEALQRLCRAYSADERAAVLSVANEFFPLADDGSGRMNRRASRQIPLEQERIRIARENGSRGGRRPNSVLRGTKPSGVPSGLAEPNPTLTQRDTQRLTNRASSPSPSPTPTPTPTPTASPAAEPASLVSATAKEKKRVAPRQARTLPETSEAWTAYTQAYRLRYSAEPVRNATVNGQMALFVARIGVEESPAVAAFYLTHSSSYYVTKGHSVGALLADAEKLRTEWATNRRVTQTQARQADQTASNPFVQILEDQRAARLAAAGK